MCKTRAPNRLLSWLWRISIATIFSYGTTLYGVEWITNLDEGLELAKIKQKPVLVYFGGDWCIWCQKLDIEFIQNPEFATFSQSVVPVKLAFPAILANYTPQQLLLKERYHIQSYPTLLILSPYGVRLGQVGYPRSSVTEFVETLATIARLPVAVQPSTL